MSIRSRAWRSLAAAGFLGALWAVHSIPPARADVPDKFTNLKVFPKDTSKEDLVQAMRAISNALGVHCNYCHVRAEGGPQNDFDWANDSKPEKTTARVMLQMVTGINSNDLSKITTKRPDKVEVTCRTCHHGAPRPIPIEEILTTAYRKGGIDSLSTRYETLRKEYYGTDTYNFGEWTIPSLAEKLAGQKDPQGTLRLAEFNLKWFPDSGVAHMMLGQAQALLGNKEEALRELNKAIEIDPKLKDNAGRIITRLEAGGR